MVLIEWKTEFEVGVPDVDHEHREIITLINDLHEAMSGEDATISVMDFLGEIYAHVAAHFALEEKIMRTKRYDQYKDHKSDHERLLDELRDIMDDYEENAYFSDEEFAGHVERWFTEHFKTKDARLHKHLGNFHLQERFISAHPQRRSAPVLFREYLMCRHCEERSDVAISY